MTYLVLARKWRPRSFETLIGQDHVVRALTHALSTQRLHHAWLFTGTRGVGKTTLSRILAKALNCETGITATPCGTCQACTEIDAGRFVDYVELDAASNRGVDEMTQLLEQAVYAPGSGRYKVYMIDEVHMLTGHAFNAMLKTLEEPPPHVKFILATTDPQKIPVTVLSRCLQFNLKQMTVPAIVEHLDGVLGQENIPFELPGLRLIAQAAAGSMRDALSLTDQAIAYSAGSLSTEAVQGMLGTIDQGHLCQLLTALSMKDASAILQVADDLASRGLSYSAALADLAVLLSHIAIEQRLPGATPPENPLQADIQRLAASLGPDFVQLFYSVAVHSRSELSLAPDEYAGFVMACLRMLALMPEGTAPAQPPVNPPSGSARPVVARPAESAAAAESNANVVPAATTSVPEAAVQPVPEPKTPSAALSSGLVPDQPERPSQIEEQRAPSPLPSEASPPVVMVGGTALNTTQAEPESKKSSSASSVPAIPAAPATSVSPAGPARIASSATPATTNRAEALPAQSQADDIPAWEELPADQSRAAAEVLPPAVRSSEAILAEPDRSMADVAISDEQNSETTQFSDGPPVDFDNIPFDDQIHDGDSDYEQSFDDELVQAAPEVNPAELSAVLGAATHDGSAQQHKPIKLGRMQPKDWPAVAASLPLSGWAGQLARQSEWVGVADQQITLRVEIRSADDSHAKARLTTVLAEYFTEVLRLHIEYGSTGSETAHAVEQAERAERQQQAEHDAQVDPFIVALINEFDARLLPGSVRANHHKAA
ncbi:DNA polymerase III subunit gamma/tau [Paenalcaligenes niemegkensis]|uniref:DNA polymerase III subunit gamma/tau n=1 Tax=Paenalcaligenes niemegkensis TaxID=2895469 RepID=UPI001EE867CD|nr:DNA polymerase III subunit gamma/tau [Paenalcaligenes niemegkensis]MCQ9615822.1 DNA polymerase III subunit gamma/tau [Paenalcaligenes niemegkensis]